MGSWFPIALFPEQALDNSILTPVLIGLFFLLLFTEFFGWVFVGYVVPGYLAVVFVSFPESGIAIIIEAILTYNIAYLISDYFSKYGLWARFFGRERFLLFVYVSVVVRLVMEAVVFPKINYSLGELLGLGVQEEFFSIGLVLVPLLANSFWKTGLFKGLMQTGTITLLTFLFLYFVLLPYTNLNVSKFELTYENLALDFTSAPKLYIILLTGAFLASQFNVRYGWDFNGIMVPALLAIAIFMPLKVVATFGESLGTAIAFVALTSLPVIKKLNFGGGRKVTAIFVLSYIMKWFLAVFFPAFPGMQVTDLFGFGYVLPSLLAVKIVAKRSSPKVLFPAFNTALDAVIVGSLIGFVLQMGQTLWLENVPRMETATEISRTAEEGALFRDLLLSKAYVLTGTFAEKYHPAAVETDKTAEAILELLDDPTPVDTCFRLMQEAKVPGMPDFRCMYREDPELGPYLIFREDVTSILQRRGTGVYIVRPNGRGPLLQIPYPLREPLSLEAAFVMAKTTDARAVMIAGVDDPENEAVWANALQDTGSVLQRVYRRLSGRDVIQIRMAAEEEQNLYVRYHLPDSLRLAPLRESIGDFNLRWSPPPETAVQWRTSTAAFSVLSLNEDVVRTISPRFKFVGDMVRIEEPISLTGLIEGWIVEQKDYIRLANSGKFKPPKWTDLELLRNEVVRPLLQLAQSGVPTFNAKDFSTIQLVAEFLGYEIIWFTDTRSNKNFLILRENPKHDLDQGWGTIVLRWGDARPWLFMVPRPLAEQGSVGMAARWFEDFKVRMLFLPEASHHADPWGRSNILNMNAPRSLAYIVLREFIRENRESPSWLAAVVRGARAWRMRQPIMLSTGEELLSDAHLSPAVKELYHQLEQGDTPVGLFRGEVADVGLQGVGNPLSGLVRVLAPGHYATLWISDERRRAIMEGERLRRLLKLYDAIGLKYSIGETDALLDRLVKPMSKGQIQTALQASVPRLLRRYSLDGNLPALRSLLRNKAVRLSALVDLKATMVYLVTDIPGQRCISAVGSGGVPLTYFRFDEEDVSKQHSFCFSLRPGIAPRMDAERIHQVPDNAVEETP